MAKKKTGIPQWKKVLIALLLIVLAGGTWAGYEFYRTVYSPNVVMEAEEGFFHIPTGSDLKAVTDLLQQKGMILNRASFEWVAKQKQYELNVKPGRYRLTSGMSNNGLIDLLRSGKQVPLMVTFNNIRLKEELAGRIARQIEADSTALVRLLYDPSFAKKYGLTSETLPTLFIPNTYEFWWNTSAEQFVERMAKEYKAFWTEERKAKAKRIGLGQSEVSILASIVQKETNMRDEQPTVAGVYLNRLKKGMLLQADPTLVFANRDFEARRVLNRHKEIDSPYNTYRYKGLPPGPICLPDPRTIDAVLNAETHSYLYFCAKADGSGYHSFATTYNEHLRNAREFQRELNRRKVYR
jgi:UPF0755 protein